MKSKFTLLVFLLFAIGCSKEKTERELYEETTSSFTYKTYKAASSTAVGPAVALYNHELPDSIAPVKTEYAHLLLGYLWTISKKPAMAFAEADLAQESTDDDVRYLAQSLRSIAMYEQGWDTLAHEESQLAKSQLRKSKSEIQYEATVFYMLLGLAKAYEKDFNGSKFYWAGFANETGIHWPYQLTDAIADLQANRLQQGLQKLKVLSQDEAVPESLRTTLAAQIEAIEKKGGDVESPLFWPKLISSLVIDELKKSSSSQMTSLLNMLEGLMKKLPG